MISLLVSILVLAVIAVIVIWILRYMGAPDQFEKIVALVCALVLLLLVPDAFGERVGPWHEPRVIGHWYTFDFPAKNGHPAESRQ